MYASTLKYAGRCECAKQHRALEGDAVHSHVHALYLPYYAESRRLTRGHAPIRLFLSDHLL